MIKRSYSHSSNTSSSANGKLAQDNSQNSYSKKIPQYFNPRTRNSQDPRSNQLLSNAVNHNPCEINSSFVDYVMQDLDYQNQNAKLDTSAIKQEGKSESPVRIRQKREEDQPQIHYSYKQSTPPLYSQHQKINYKDYHNNVKGEGRRAESAMGECKSINNNIYESNNSSHQASSFMENKRQKQNSQSNGKCVYKIFPNIQLKLPVITQQNASHNIQQNQHSSQHQNGYRPYQLGYSLDQHPLNYASGSKSNTKTEQSPRGQTAGVSPHQNIANNYNINNNININLTNNNNVKSFIDKSFDELMHRVSTDNTQVNKLKTKSTEQGNITPNSNSKQISKISHTEVSDFSPHEYMQTDNSTVKPNDLLNSKRKILLKFKPKQQTKNKLVNVNGASSSSNAQNASFNMGDFMKSRFQQDKLMNYISCKFNQIDKSQTNMISKDEIIKFFETNINNPISNYKEMEQYITSNFSAFVLDVVERETERAGLLNFREFKQLFNDFFHKSIASANAIESKTNKYYMQNNFRNQQTDQSISEIVLENKRQVSSEIKNYRNPTESTTSKRIFSAQKTRNQDQEDLFTSHQKDNSFHIPSSRKPLHYQTKLQQASSQYKGPHYNLQNILQQEQQLNNQQNVNTNNAFNKQNNAINQSNNLINQSNITVNPNGNSANVNNRSSSQSNRSTQNQINSVNQIIKPSSNNSSNNIQQQQQQQSQKNNIPIQKYQTNQISNKNQSSHVQIPTTNNTSFSEKDFQSPRKVRNYKQQEKQINQESKTDEKETQSKSVQQQEIASSDSVQKIQQIQQLPKNIPPKKEKTSSNHENFLIKQRSTSKSLHNQHNSNATHNIDYTRNFSRESDSTRISANQSKTPEKLSLEESQQIFFMKKQQQDSDAHLQGIGNSRYDTKTPFSTEFSKSRSDSKQLTGQDVTKSSSFTDKSIVQGHEGNHRYYFSSSSSKQIQEENHEGKLAFEDQKLNKILEKSKLSSQRNSFIGMSGSLLLRQYNMTFKINSPTKKNSLSMHESNPIIEQNEPTLTEPNEQTITERNENLQITKFDSPNKGKDFECTFRPQSLERELNEIKQLNILQVDSQNTNNEQVEEIQSLLLNQNQLKVQSFCNSPPNNLLETPQYQQLKILDINSNLTNTQQKKKKSAESATKDAQENNSVAITENVLENNNTSESKRRKKSSKIKQEIKSDEVIECHDRLEQQGCVGEAQEMNNVNTENTEEVLGSIDKEIKKHKKARKSLSDNKNLSLNLINRDDNSNGNQNISAEQQEEHTTKSQNQIKYQDHQDDTKKSIYTKPSAKSTFSQYQNTDSQNFKTEVLNSHIDQNCQNFLKKKEVKVLKKSFAKKPSESVTKQATTNEDYIDQQQKVVNGETKFEGGNEDIFIEDKNILNDITFDNNSHSINLENKKKNSIQFGDYKQFYQNDSLSNSNSKLI